MNEIESPEFWTDTDVLEFENVRIHLRGLIQFIGINPVRIIETGLKDRILGEKEGDTLEPETFEDYKEKVDHYFLQHMDDVPAVKTGPQ